MPKYKFITVSEKDKRALKINFDPTKLETPIFVILKRKGGGTFYLKESESYFPTFFEQYLFFDGMLRFEAPKECYPKNVYEIIVENNKPKSFYQDKYLSNDVAVTFLKEFCKQYGHIAKIVLVTINTIISDVAYTNSLEDDRKIPVSLPPIEKIEEKSQSFVFDFFLRKCNKHDVFSFLSLIDMPDKNYTKYSESFHMRMREFIKIILSS